MGHIVTVNRGHSTFEKLGSLRWDAVAVGVLVLAAALYSYQTNPYYLAAENSGVHGSRPPDRIEGDVLLLIPDSPAANARAVSELDCTYGWFNALWQQTGSFGTALTRNLSPELLAGRHTVIIPEQVARALPETGRNALHEFARNGGNLVVELPTSGWGPVAGFDSVSEGDQPAELISIEAPKGSPYRKLEGLPLFGDHSGVRLHEETETLAKTDTGPALTVRQTGDGAVFASFVNIGCTVTVLQQGLTDPKSQSISIGADRQFQPTAARSVEFQRQHPAVPSADLLESFIVEKLRDQTPFGTLWKYPPDKKGLVSVTHPVHRPADTPALHAYREWTRSQDFAGTPMVTLGSVLSDSGISGARQSEQPVGLIWPRAEKDVEPAPFRFGPATLYEYERTLTRQLDKLENTIGSSAVRFTRTQNTLWQSSWGATFQSLAGADVSLDTSFGGLQKNRYGYLFGTSYPYYPIDRGGLPFPLLELPFTFHGPNIRPESIATFATDSAKKYHEPVVISAPANMMARTPSANRLEALQVAVERAKKLNLWKVDLRAFQTFLTDRRQSVLTSQWSPEKRRLELSVDLASPKGPVPGIVVPERVDEEPVESVRRLVDEKWVAIQPSKHMSISRDRVVFELPPGEHSVRITY